MLVTELAVGEVAEETDVILTVFSLSVNNVAFPWSVRAHPSGTFTVKPVKDPPDGW
ncbi:hypothetical protein [Streptomyces sp. NPDC004589]|uniref:hypothetical protein n=1 Tax=unclassified Streptomyces TaxID=2593676 RepID=UPI0033B055D2